ncbi:immunoglobulin domain-containing protein, partial [Edaphobacter aggregans]|uniref:immunoglobulin domain-containing protein n=1 Tax=Edaphobacter aggregans TaxID=570835 RepID=UPI001B7FF138
MKTHVRYVQALLCLVLICLLSMSHPAKAQGATLAPSKRVVINMGQRPWKFIVGDNIVMKNPAFNDSSWESVGLPHTADMLFTFTNETSGGGAGDLNGNVAWYRQHFTVAPQYANNKVQVVFEGAHTGVQVYINGTLVPATQQFAPQATHVVGFLPFVVDLTPYVQFGGDNVIAVRIARNADWFPSPGFSQAFRFGQADNGIFRPVYMYITDKIHIPENIYSGSKTWGTYVATDAINDDSATIHVQTNVMNEGTTPQDVTLTTQIVDANGNVVASRQDVQTVVPSAAANPQPKLFDQTLTVNHPTLWYPNNSIYGKPYMYKVFHIISVNGVVIDAKQSPLGIRTITWDKDFVYINGKLQKLWGGSGRYDYPGFASSVPEEQKWRDLQQMAAMGGNLWRPGHSAESEEFVNAADALGIMVVQPSGDGENGFSDPCGPTAKMTCEQEELKLELHRDMIVRDRSHPSILAWEADNGVALPAFAQQVAAVGKQWDYLGSDGAINGPRGGHAQSDRSGGQPQFANNGDFMSCSGNGCDIGVKDGIPDKPAWGAEYWGPGVIRGDHDHEISMAAQYIDNWSRGIAKHTFGLAQWYFADSPGEIGTYTDLPEDDASHNTERSIGDSMVDFERFPRLLYYIEEANWTPYSVKHVVKLAHTWNRSGNIQVNAWSNCPAVRLLINGVPQGQDQIPNPWSSLAANDRDFVATELTTSLPGQVHWNVTWQPGTATAQCMDQLGQVATDADGKPVVDTLTTAGAPDHIVLENVANVVRPDGTSFQVTANGTDAQFVVAKVVDANGVVVPGASNLLTFSVSGPGTYVGGTQQMVTPGQPHSYHSPGDPELAAEDGLQKIAIRSQFTPGVVTVTATSPGLTGASTQFNIFPIPQQITTATAPAIIAEPVDTSVTQGFPAHFSVTASGADPLAFQWYKNGVAIPGATSAAVDTAPTVASDDQSAFSVTVTNSLGSATSTNAMLTVVAAAAPAITVQPMSQTASQGQTVTFTVQATGSPKLTYQWTRNGAPIPGAILSSYTTPTLSVSDSGSVYAVTVTNPVNSAVSTNATLTVNPAVAPQIVTDPVNVAALPGQPATFSVTVTGTQPIVYVWEKDGTPVGTGSNSPTLTINSVSNGDLGTYTVTATNIAGQAVSKGATLTLAPPGVNMSLGKVGLGSSFENAVGLASKFAIDGDLTTRWGSAFSDPQSYQIDFGVPMTFNRAVINWDPSHATQYVIQVSNDGQSWSGPVYSQDSGTGGKDDFTFAAQHARYIRMFGTQRNDNFGYSIREFETYNAASCGNSNERWTIDPNNLTVVTDNLSGLVWTRTQKTDNTAGAQFTQVSAINYCQSLGMRIPTLAEAQAISGSSAASCAFPAFWATWTSTDDPDDNSRAFNVDATGNQFFGIKVNSPGATLCVQGPEQQPPVITQQPSPVTVAANQQATFSVVATTTGNGSPTYTWLKNNVPFQITGVPAVTTPVVTAADNGALYSVVVTGGNGLTTTSTAGVLTVTGPTGGGGGTTCTAAPSAPGTLNASATASGQINMVWGASTAGNGCAVTYSVYRGTTAGVTPSAANLRVTTSATVFTDTGLAPSTTYFYIVVASDSVGASAASNTASATTSAGCTTNCPTEVIAISAGGPAAGNFAADEDFTGGNPSGSNATVNTSGVTNPAPQSVYQHMRVGNSTYTLPGLTPGASYTVRLHFNEFYWTQPGQRVFNVSINGTQVLNNFDVLAAAGGQNVAIAEQFTANANAQGQIVIQFTTVKDNAAVSGIEVLASTATTTPPAAPSNLTATVASSSQINLSWTASSTSGVTYMVLRNGVAVASGLTGTTYIDTGLTASTTYSYTVEAVDAGGTS